MELKQKINLQYFAEDTAAAETAANTVTGAEEVQDAAEQTGETAENNSEENTRVAAEGNNDKAQGNASDYLSAILELPEEKNQTYSEAY